MWIKILFRLGFFALFVGSISFLLALGLFTISVHSGALPLAIPLGVAVYKIGLQVATASAIVGGSLALLVQTLVIKMVRWIKPGFDQQRDQINEDFELGKISVQEMLIKHYKINYEETNQTSTIISIFSEKTSSEDRELFETQLFISKYVLPMLIDFYPEYDASSGKTGFEYWNPLVQSLIGCYQKVIGRSNLFQRNFSWKLNPQKLAVKVQEEHLANNQTHGSPAWFDSSKESSAKVVSSEPNKSHNEHEQRGIDLEKSFES